MLKTEMHWKKLYGVVGISKEKKSWKKKENVFLCRYKIVKLLISNKKVTFLSRLSREKCSSDGRKWVGDFLFQEWRYDDILNWG